MDGDDGAVGDGGVREEVGFEFCGGDLEALEFVVVRMAKYTEGCRD